MIDILLFSIGFAIGFGAFPVAIIVLASFVSNDELDGY